MSRYGWWMALCTALLCLGCVGSRSGDTGGDDDDSGLPSDDDDAVTDDDDSGKPSDDDDAVADDDDSAALPFCGDGVANADEECDDKDLLDATCNGIVGCTKQCELDWTGCTNSSLEFDGATTQVQVENFDLRASQATWEAWVKTRSHVNYGKVIDFGLGGGVGRRFTLQSRATGFDCDLDGGASGVAFWDTDEVDTWRHIACVWDGTTLGIWVDGELQDSFGGTVNTTIDVTIEEKYIGHRNGGYFDGHLDEIRVWNIARTPEELNAALFKRVNFEAGLVGYWRFDDSSGSIATDSSGNGFDGTLETLPEGIGSGPTWSADTPW